MVDFDALSRVLNSREPERIDGADLRPAAVLLPLYVAQGEEHLIFTRRTREVRHHRGEISFPGGAREPEDFDLCQTALRETQEELGIEPGGVRVLGRLDDFYSVHGYHVTPYVGVIPWPCPLQVDAGEIDEVIRLPLSRLRDPAIFSTEDWRHRGRLHPVHFYRLDGYEIWGLTASMLRQLLQRIDACRSA